MAMGLTINRVPEEDLLAFATRYSIEIIVEERRGNKGLRLPRFYAHAAGVDIKEGSFLRRGCANGNNPDEALIALAREWSEELLVVDDSSPSRREISAPRLSHGLVARPDLDGRG